MALATNYLDGRSSRHLSFSNYFLVNSHPCSEYFDDIHRKSPPPMLPMLLSVGETSCSYHQLQTGILNVISISKKNISKLETKCSISINIPTGLLLLFRCVLLISKLAFIYFRNHTFHSHVWILSRHVSGAHTETIFY